MPTGYANPKKEGELLPTLQEIIETKKGDHVPIEAAWIWGDQDEVGRLNLLTADHIKTIMESEPKYGLVSSLNWDVTYPQRPAFGRQVCDRQIMPFHEHIVNDETLNMNTQSGSQFDGFRHIAHQSTKLFYNNLTQEEITGGKGQEITTRCGIQAASKHGVVGRGVLLDFARWAEEVAGITYDPFKTRGITFEEIRAVAAWEGVEFQRGDILLIRSGWMKTYNKCLADGAEERLARVSTETPQSIGVEPSKETIKWLHDQYFAVVGGDQPAFESWPPKTQPILHEYLLACWGIMIGEMLDLEDLSEKCKEIGKYSFLFMSAPLNIPGGVATLANALCVL